MLVTHFNNLKIPEVVPGMTRMVPLLVTHGGLDHWPVTCETVISDP